MPELITLREFARRVGVKKDTVVKWVKAGMIPIASTGARHTIYVDAAHVESVTDLRVLHRISPGTVQAVTLGGKK